MKVLNKISLTGRILNEYNRQTQQDIATSIESSINQAADGYLFPVMPITANYTMNLNDCLILVNATSGVVTVTLKPAEECKQKMVIVKKTDASANAVTVDGNGSETIDGATTSALSSQWETIRIMSDGAQWLII